jgi:uncharacterized glyoxalase superfamily protein PhnB
MNIVDSPAHLYPTVRPLDVNARALIDFLTEAFGFEEIYVYSEGGRIQHAELAWPFGGGVMLDTTDEPGTEGKPPCVYCVCDDPDALYERAKAAGATITREIRTTPYGAREFACWDIHGNRWSFGSHPGFPRGREPIREDGRMEAKPPVAPKAHA